MIVTVYNTTTAPVTVDAEGRQIGGNDWGTVDTTQDLVKPELEPGGALIRVDIDVTQAQHPDALVAAQRTEAVAARADDLADVDKARLAAAAKDAGVPDADELSKPDLVYALASRPDVVIPEAEPADADEPASADEAVSQPQTNDDVPPKSRRAR